MSVGESTKVAGGLTLVGSYVYGSEKRSYKLYVPQGDREGRTALVVMLHGCMQGRDAFAAGTRMNEIAERDNFLVLYPAQSVYAHRFGCWNWQDPDHQENGKGEPAVIAGMTQAVAEDYEIDPGRVYIAGMSAGGAMAGVMGEAYPDLYAAVGVHSGLGYKAAHDLYSSVAAMRSGGTVAGAAVPTIVFHGDEDATVNVSNSDRLLERLDGADGSVEGPEGASPGPTEIIEGRAPGGHRYTRYVYAGEGGPSVERWIVHRMGHAWSGGSAMGTYTDARGPDASEEMIRFFRENSR
ncbi:MAG: PHB depolymerase family esterase [Actinomycetota bacterium]|nr:PHB depolymerase family esterase [Actinomycetota bacterium]